MSDEWELYPCTVGEEPAWIMVDSGIAETLEQSPAVLAKIVLEFKQPLQNALPNAEEHEAARTIEDRIESFVQQEGDVFAGRVTIAGTRQFYVYTRHDEAAWNRFGSALAKESGYAMNLVYRNDPGHQAYWNELYPSPDDWRVINDMKVLDNLSESGDVADAVRRFDHWIYFGSEAAAGPFIAWAVGDRFSLIEDETGPDDDGRYRVRLSHEGTAKLGDVTDHTAALRRKAEDEFGGDYDGWETFVMRDETNQS
jgi:hypothetical protein